MVISIFLGCWICDHLGTILIHTTPKEINFQPTLNVYIMNIIYYKYYIL